MKLQSPIASYVAKMKTSRLDGKNCCLRECSFPLCSLLCVDAKVVLLVNYIVEYKLMNGSIGVVKQLCFSNPEEDKKRTDDSRMYVVVDFPESTIPEHQKLISNQPKTWIPIPLFTRQWDKKCCSITAIPLMVCKSLSIHKSQGMTVGHEKQFTKLVVHLLVGVGGNKCPGLELVAVSRAVYLYYKRLKCRRCRRCCRHWCVCTVNSTYVAISV